MTEPPPANQNWTRAFGLIAFLVAAAVVSIGWCTGLRGAMHGALLAVAAVAFLPLLVAGVGIGLMLVSIPIALFTFDPGVTEAGANAAVGLADIGGGIAPAYYRFLARRRHPAFWAAVVGLLLGGLALWGVIGLVIVPGEARTVTTLVEAQGAIDAYYVENKRYPRPNEGGYLQRSTCDPAAPGDELLLDGFGQPFEYDVTGAWKLSSYRLISRGFDGHPSDDDLCIADATKLAKAAHAARALLDMVSKVREGKRISIAEKLRGINSLRCDE